MRSFIHALKAFLIVACGAAGLFVAAALLDPPALVAIYANRFDFRPGAVVAERIALTDDAARTCLVVGASTARQSFDPELLERDMQGVAFRNAGTTGGTIEVLELQARIVQRYGLRYRCIIAGLHPWLLKHVQQPQLVDTEYLGQLGLVGTLRLSSSWWMETELAKVALGLALPLRRHAGQLNRMARQSLFSAQARLRTHPRGIAEYEILPGDLQPYPTFAYPGNPKLFLSRRKDFEDALRRLAWLDRASYNSDQTLKVFRTALHVLADHTDRLLVVTLPDTDLWDLPNAWATGPYLETIATLGARATHVDCRGVLRIDEFVDHAHANDDGRATLTAALSHALRPLLGLKFSEHAPPPSAVPERTCK